MLFACFRKKMPKKFAGENSKAAAAKARKTATKEQQHAEKQKKAEDEYWQDTDKHVLRKQQRKEEQDRKKQEAAGRKAESKALLEQEMSSIKKPPSKPAPPAKVTRAQVAENVASTGAIKKEKEKIVETHLDLPLEENLNRLTIEGEEARTVTEAISLLSSKQPEADKHPEKRMKAAYTAFEERRLKTLKEEQPTLRLSQLKQMIFKEWQKSPENPLNNE